MFNKSMDFYQQQSARKRLKYGFGNVKVREKDLMVQRKFG